MRDALRAGWYGFLSLAVAVCALVTAPRVNAERCTNLIDYAGDPRSNAIINSIGASTGQCPQPMTGATAPAVSTMPRQTTGPTYGDGQEFVEQVNERGILQGMPPGPVMQILVSICDNAKYPVALVDLVMTSYGLSQKDATWLVKTGLDKCQ